MPRDTPMLPMLPDTWPLPPLDPSRGASSRLRLTLLTESTTASAQSAVIVPSERAMLAAVGFLARYLSSASAISRGGASVMSSRFAHVVSAVSTLVDDSVLQYRSRMWTRLGSMMSRHAPFWNAVASGL